MGKEKIEKSELKDCDDFCDITEIDKIKTIEDWWIVGLYYKISFKLEDMKLAVKFGLQRMFRGYDDTAEWSLCSYLTEIALPVLKKYRKSAYGVPHNKDTNEFHTEKEWNNRLDKMIVAFELISDEDIDYTRDDIIEQFKKRNVKINIGIKEFGDYFQNLWS